SIEGESEKEVERTADTLSPAFNSVAVSSPQGESGDRVLRTNVSPQLSDAQDRPAIRKTHEEMGRGDENSLRSKRTNSCPPEASRSVISVPWSLEWLHDHNHGDAGVIFSASKKAKKRDHHGEKQKKIEQQDP
ncbi:DUF4283 domain protein, partial [Trifolium medium]|nr:DUF4283 domain protein [Trifolium medium]